MASQYAAFDAVVNPEPSKDGEPHPMVAPLSSDTAQSVPRGPQNDKMYTDLMSKEDSVLQLVRRVDETRREEALRSADRVAPLVSAYVAGLSKFIARLMHYLSSGATEEAASLIRTPDGLVYAGTLMVAVSIVLILLL